MRIHQSFSVWNMCVFADAFSLLRRLPRRGDTISLEMPYKTIKLILFRESSKYLIDMQGIPAERTVRDLVHIPAFL